MITTQQQLDLAQARLDKNLKVRTAVEKIIADLKDQHVALSDELQAHLLTLTQLNMDSANFIKHTFGAVQNATIETDTDLLTLDEEGHIEAAIATDLDSWKDGSSVTWHRKEA